MPCLRRGFSTCKPKRLARVLEIVECPPEDLRPLRARMLRPGFPFESTLFPQDHDPDTLHLAGRLSGEIVTIATFQREAHPEFQAERPYRLRGMATAEEFHGQGFGRAILREGLRLLEERGCDFVWANAREVAFPFYEKEGFSFHGGMFEIPTVGPHKVIYKSLNSR